MIHPIYPCLWFDHQAKEASEYYCSLFPDSHIQTANPIAVLSQMADIQFMALNGGPLFKMNPAISFFVTCEDKPEIDQLWHKISEGGQVLMNLDPYPWSEYYGWCSDRYGMSWQLYLGKMEQVNQKIVPSLLFTNENFRKAEEAIRYYITLFPDSIIEGILHYDDSNPQTAGAVQHAQFRLMNQVFMAMDGPGEHAFTFNEGVSFVVNCDTQEEIDFLWKELTANGGEESMCGWLKDRFGVSWQIVPSQLGVWMADPIRGPKVMEAFLKMKKFDIETLQNIPS